MWMLINNKPVCLLNIVNITEVIPITFRKLILYDKNIAYYSKNIYSEHKEFIDSMFKKYDIENTRDCLTIKDEDNKIFGYCFNISYISNGEKHIIYSILYKNVADAQKALENLLGNINKVYYNLEKIQI